MSTLTNPVTGHRISTDDESVEFWTTAGYRVQQEKKAPAKKAAAKRTSSKES